FGSGSCGPPDCCPGVSHIIIHIIESDIESTTKEGAMKSLKELKDFFSNDPMGQKLAAICKDLKEFFLLAQTKTHSAFKDYVKRLMAEES
ncbi:hypothetical protein FTX61_27195, partial [Nitriliruptoraceae bacterium ZYF776]|nr:hypothetical protein [Profundirhabdus halotolerans]